MGWYILLLYIFYSNFIYHCMFSIPKHLIFVTSCHDLGFFTIVIWSLLIFPTYPQSPCYQGKNDFWGIFRKIKISVKNISLIQVYPWFYQLFFYSFFMLWYNLTVSQIWSSIFFKYLIFKGDLMSHWLISIIFK